MHVRYLWFNSPAPDFTVGVYSKQNLIVKEWTGKISKYHMDGTFPSGFTNSTYMGMNGWNAVTNSSTASPYAVP